MELIRTQTHSEGRIIIKCNHLIDPEVIEALYAASCAGARIDLIVRSSCGVRPGIAGMSENIWVRSLVGRYLEHSRIYHFGPDRWYIGSADLMGRNLDGRIETVVPVIDPRLQARLAEIVDVLLADDVLASELQADGSWRKVPDRPGTRRSGGAAQARGRARRAVTVAGESTPASRAAARGADHLLAGCRSRTRRARRPSSPSRFARLRTTHWDTADLRLARWGVALEHSAETGWVLRLPATSEGMTAPDGAELHFEGAADRPPDSRAPPRPRLRAPRPVELVARLVTLTARHGAPGRRRRPACPPRRRHRFRVLRRRASRSGSARSTCQCASESLLDQIATRFEAAGAQPARPRALVARALGLGGVTAAGARATVTLGAGRDRRRCRPTRAQPRR